MTTEDPSIKKLKSFANRTNRSVHCSVQAYPTNAMARVRHHQRLLHIPNNADNTSLLVCHYDPKKIGDLEIYCGVFFPVSSKDKIVIRQKDMLDKINIFSKNKRAKTGYSVFDSKTIISECSDHSRLKIFQNQKIQEKILEAFGLDLRMKAGLNAMSLDYIKELEGKPHLGIYITGEWILEDEKLEQLFSIAETIRSQILMNN
ncbi:hypothetical protein [Carboxylicivirga sp. N1Y90]|uniref:hypothetical protein n=1 Tax=Carboxylicivirga fragile TaxID=3417571 RepID=UPI003D346E85|nr:hypothetical protein [Marinilabiliaceae bacterium N1Y90]